MWEFHGAIDLLLTHSLATLHLGFSAFGDVETQNALSMGMWQVRVGTSPSERSFPSP